MVPRRRKRPLSALSALWLCLAAMLAYPTAAARAEETITIVADDWCPYNCDPASDKPGIIIEIAREAFARHGIAIDYKIVAWARALAGTRAGHFNAITGAAHTDAPDFVFPATAQSLSVMTFYTRPGSTWRYTGLDSLAAVSLGSISQYSYGKQVDDYIAAHKNDMAKIQLVSGNLALHSNVMKAIKGRIGATIESAAVMDHFLMTNGLSGRMQPVGHVPSDSDERLYVAFSPKNPNSPRYAKILSDETASMRKSGEIKRILARYVENAEALDQP